ncbi:hypothetical protein K435DRAFT_61794 [Dendrothele bispora CBS 962.96]|uniref:Uncharacterized protein n=1 Tax=Dendrothele bispora (strain CBS 962.96) TaxID=1314807 RepID=A0A4S8MS29_DENBC|nr:hypothetical protein K435DRAFT_61794 [Dendrothele bispora CBS 962.96]
MLPTEHPNFPNGLPVYSSASDASDNDVSGGEGSSSPSLPPMLGGLGSGDAGGGGDSTGGKKKSIAMMMTGTGGRKSLSRVMARELVSKSRIGKGTLLLRFLPQRLPSPRPATTLVSRAWSKRSRGVRVSTRVMLMMMMMRWELGRVT